jgi:hypothetical protein
VKIIFVTSKSITPKGILLSDRLEELWPHDLPSCSCYWWVSLLLLFFGWFCPSFDCWSLFFCYTKLCLASFEAFTTVMFQVEVCVVTPCSVVGYQRFRGPCSLHLQGELNVGVLPQHYSGSQPRRLRPEIRLATVINQLRGKVIEKLIVTQLLKSPPPPPLFNPKFHYRVHVSPPLALILSCMHTVHTLSPYFPRSIPVSSIYA